jgi:hypothetical protein
VLAPAKALGLPFTSHESDVRARVEPPQQGIAVASLFFEPGVTHGDGVRAGHVRPPALLKAPTLDASLIY